MQNAGAAKGFGRQVLLFECAGGGCAQSAQDCGQIQAREQGLCFQIGSEIISYLWTLVNKIAKLTWAGNRKVGVLLEQICIIVLST